jgi:hypothetical protein
VLELPHVDSRSFDRATVLVDVEPVGVEANGRPTERPEPAVVRRYRHEPSPLVRDAAGARTGRIDLVLAGNFDLLAAVTPGIGLPLGNRLVNLRDTDRYSPGRP